MATKPLTFVLKTGRRANFSDLHDKIYGMLGIAPSNIRKQSTNRLSDAGRISM